MNKTVLKKKIGEIVLQLIEEKNYVSSVDLLMKLGYLSKVDYEQWRFGKVKYLEKVCKINLSKLTYINKTLSIIGKEMNLKESRTVYMKYSKGPKIKLKFSKSNNEQIEKSYSTHYVLRKK